jgi:hypothetical protein
MPSKSTHNNSQLTTRASVPARRSCWPPQCGCVAVVADATGGERPAGSVAVVWLAWQLWSWMWWWMHASSQS